MIVVRKPVNIYSGQVQRGQFQEPQLAEVRALGFPIRVVDQLRNHEIGYWIGMTIDPARGKISGASLRRLDGIAAGQ